MLAQIASSYKIASKKRYHFSGRATRAEFWWAMSVMLVQWLVLFFALLVPLVVLMLVAGISLLEGMSGGGGFSNGGSPIIGAIAAATAVLCVLTPSVLFFIKLLAILSRRFHDRNLRGWWQVLIFLPLFIQGVLHIHAPVIGTLVWLVMFGMGFVPSKVGANRFAESATIPEVKRADWVFPFALYIALNIIISILTWAAVHFGREYMVHAYSSSLAEMMASDIAKRNRASGVRHPSYREKSTSMGGAASSIAATAAPRPLSAVRHTPKPIILTPEAKKSEDRYAALQTMQSDCVALNQKNLGTVTASIRNNCGCVATKLLALMSEEQVGQYLTSKQTSATPEQKTQIAKECSKP